MIRVAVQDAASAKGLVQRLAGVFEPTLLLLDADRGEVRVEAKRESRQDVTRTLDLIADWLEEVEVASVVVLLGGKSHRVVRRPAEIASAR